MQIGAQLRPREPVRNVELGSPRCGAVPRQDPKPPTRAAVAVTTARLPFST